MEGLQIQRSESPNGAHILTLQGVLTIRTLFEFQDLLRKEDGHGLIINLTDVPYMDSAGLGTLLGGLAACQRTGRGFALTGISERVLTLFQVAGVDKLVPRFDSVEAAEKQFPAKAGHS